MELFDRLHLGTTQQDLLNIVKNFNYLPNLYKNITPFETNIEDIFDLIISTSLNLYGLKEFLRFHLRETTTGEYCYRVSTFTLPAVKGTTTSIVPTFDYRMSNRGVMKSKGQTNSGYRPITPDIHSYMRNNTRDRGEKPYSELSIDITFQTSTIESKIKHRLKGNNV